MRPFEVGDLIVTTHHKRLLIVDIAKDYVEAKMEIDAFGYHYFDLMGKQKRRSKHLGEIKTIRRPRKGNAESRAIVAMMGNEFLIARRISHRNLEKPFKEINGIGYTHLKRTVFNKAKLMLK